MTGGTHNRAWAAALLPRLAPLVLAALLLGIWEACVYMAEVPPYILPAPSDIWRELVLPASGLFAALLVTLKITFWALAAATVCGVVVAVAVSRSRLFEAAVFPYLVTLQVTPVVAIAPLIIIWVDDPFTAVLLCAGIVAFFPVTANTLQGLRSTDRDLEALFALYGARRWQTFVYLYVPSALPAFFTGLRISGGLALIGAVVAEFVAGTGGVETGLAYRILEAGYRLNIARMFAALFLLSLSGIAIYAIIDTIGHRLLRRWHVSVREAR